MEKRLKRRIKGQELQKIENIGFKNYLKCMIRNAKVGAVKTLVSVTKQPKSKYTKTQENTKRADPGMMPKNAFESNPISTKTNSGKTVIGDNTNAKIHRNSINASTKIPPKKAENMICGSQIVNNANRSTRISKTASEQKINNNSMQNKDMKRACHTTSNKIKNSKCTVQQILSTTAVRM